MYNVLAMRLTFCSSFFMQRCLVESLSFNYSLFSHMLGKDPRLGGWCCVWLKARVKQYMSKCGERITNLASVKPDLQISCSIRWQRRKVSPEVLCDLPSSVGNQVARKVGENYRITLAKIIVFAIARSWNLGIMFLRMLSINSAEKKRMSTFHRSSTISVFA